MGELDIIPILSKLSVYILYISFLLINNHIFVLVNNSIMKINRKFRKKIANYLNFEASFRLKRADEVESKEHIAPHTHRDRS